MVECVRLTEPVPAIEEDRQSLLLAGGRGRVVAGQFLDDAQELEGVGLAGRVPRAAEDRQSLLLAGGGGLVVPGQVLDDAQMVEGVGLAGPVPGIRAAARAAW